MKTNQAKMVEHSFRYTFCWATLYIYLIAAFVAGNLNLLNEAEGRIAFLGILMIAAIVSVKMTNARFARAVEEGIEVRFARSAAAANWLTENVHKDFYRVACDTVHDRSSWMNSVGLEDGCDATAKFADRDNAMLFKLTFGGAA